MHQLSAEQVPRGGAAGNRQGFGNPCFILPHHHLPFPIPRHLLAQLPDCTVFPGPQTVSAPFFSKCSLSPRTHISSSKIPFHASPLPITFSSRASSSPFSLFPLRLSPPTPSIPALVARTSLCPALPFCQLSLPLPFQNPQVIILHLLSWLSPISPISSPKSCFSS